MRRAIGRRLLLRVARRFIGLAAVLAAIIPPLAGAQGSNFDTPAFKIVPSGDAAYKSTGC